MSGNKRQQEIADRHPVGSVRPEESIGDAPGPDVDFSYELDRLRRGYLDLGDLSQRFSQAPLFTPAFVRIRKLPRFLDEDGRVVRQASRERQLLVSLHGLCLPVVFRFEQRGGELWLGLGLAGALSDTRSLIAGALQCQFPGSEVSVGGEPPPLPGALAALIVGTPQALPAVVGLDQPDLGSLAASLAGRDFGLTLAATPLSSAQANTHFDLAVRQIRDWSPLAREGLNVSHQAAQAVTTQMTRERIHRDARQAVQWAEILAARCTQGMAEGLWVWCGTLWAMDQATLAMASALFRGMFGGPDSLPEPIRVLPLDEGLSISGLICGSAVFSMGGQPVGTVLPTGTLAALCRLPSRSFPGLETAPSAAFSTATGDASPQRSIAVGRILDRGAETGRDLHIPLDSLASHALVVGMTGAGKTSACMRILRESFSAGVPFLVIEPAKTEYRALLRDPAVGKALRVFTLGDESGSPFRLNPFEFPEGFRVGTHLDYLKSVFVSSFSMYGPMPHIIEEAVVRSYEKHGWDLASGENVHEGRLERDFLFPTLSDLLAEIDPVIRSIGYAPELSMDIRGALRTRIRSLLTGAKGLMLGAPRSTALKDLLARPTVLELTALGDDQEKALLMGLLLVRIYEHCQVRRGLAGGLRHLTLIEEAHRILKNVSTTQVNPDVGNVVGKAVDVFNNVLAEIRAYGEGILIAEQIPTKLSPDAIKNSGFKLGMRLHAPDDRRVVGECMVLSARQQDQLAWLPDLTGIAFGAGLTEAVQVRVPTTRLEFEAGFRPVATSGIAAAMTAFWGKNRAVLERFPACVLCSQKCRRAPGALEASEDPESGESRSLSRVLLDWTLSGDSEPAALGALDEDPNSSFCKMAHLAHEYFARRATFYDLSPAERFWLERSLMEALQPRAEPAAAIARFRALWRPLLERKLREQTRVCRSCTQALC